MNQQRYQYNEDHNQNGQNQYGGGAQQYNSNNMPDNQQQQQQQLDINNMLMQEGFQNINQMSVVERTKLWAEYKEKKIREAKELKDQQDKIAQDCTFKPQINNNMKRKTARQNNYYEEQQQQSKGLDKYLQRMHQAREKKEEQQLLEEKLFKKGQNWKPKLTTPIEPNITSFKKNNDKDNGNNSNSQVQNVKALNKPVNPLRQNNQQQRLEQSDMSKIIRNNQISRTNQYDKDGSNDMSSNEIINNSSNREIMGLSPALIKNTRDFVRMAQRNKDQFVELRSDMQYDEAVNLIHQHIINLDI